MYRRPEEEQRNDIVSRSWLTSESKNQDAANDNGYAKSDECFPSLGGGGSSRNTKFSVHFDARNDERITQLEATRHKFNVEC